MAYFDINSNQPVKDASETMRVLTSIERTYSVGPISSLNALIRWGARAAVEGIVRRRRSAPAEGGM
jgi:hypothetical protein